MELTGTTARWRLGALAVTAVVALAACSGGGASPTPSSARSAPATSAAPTTATAGTAATPSTAPSATAPADLGSLKIGLGTAPPDPTSHYLYYALENGFYKGQGLTAEILPFNGDQTSLRALASGEVQVLWTGCQAAMQAIDQGADIKIISAYAPNIDYLFVVESDITSPKGLEGRNLGVSQPGAVSFTVPQLMIEADGGDFTKVNVVSVGGSSARVQSLIAKQIDGAVLNSSFAERTKAYDYLHSIAEGVTALPDYIYACEVTTGKLLNERRDAIQAFVTGTMQGVRWFYDGDNSKAAATITQKQLPDTDPAELAAGVETFKAKHFWKENGTLAEKAWDFTLKVAREAGDIQKELKYADVVDVSLTENARKAVGG